MLPVLGYRLPAVPAVVHTLKSGDRFFIKKKLQYIEIFTTAI